MNVSITPLDGSSGMTPACTLSPTKDTATRHKNNFILNLLFPGCLMPSSDSATWEKTAARIEITEVKKILCSSELGLRRVIIWQTTLQIVLLIDDKT